MSNHPVCLKQVSINITINRRVVFMEFCFPSLSDLCNILGEN